MRLSWNLMWLFLLFLGKISGKLPDSLGGVRGRIFKEERESHFLFFEVWNLGKKEYWKKKVINREQWSEVIEWIRLGVGFKEMGGVQTEGMDRERPT